MPFSTRPVSEQIDAQRVVQSQQQFYSNNGNPSSQAGIVFPDWTNGHRHTSSESGMNPLNRMASSNSVNSATSSVASPFTMMQQQQQQAGFRMPPNSTMSSFSSFGQDSMPSSSSFSGFPQAQRNDMPQQNLMIGTTSPSFSSHRRTETAPASSTYFPASSSNSNVKVESPPDQFFGFQPSPVSFRANSTGPLRVHQYFPTMGENGVPVTILVTVKSDWARNIGLQLADRRSASGSMWSNTGRSSPNTHLVVSFGNIDVETRAERSMAGIDSPIGGFASLDMQQNQQQQGLDLDLTVIAHAPPYPGNPLAYPNLGGKVPIRIRLVGAMNEPVWDPLSGGVEVGEFCYWQVSPKSNLKRTGAQLVEQQTLRRPASFPNFGSQVSMEQDPQQSVEGYKRRGAVAADSVPTRPRLLHRSTMSTTSIDGGSQSFNFSPDQINFASQQNRTGSNLQFGAVSQAQEVDSGRPMGGDTNPMLIRSSQLYMNGATPSTSVSGSTAASTMFGTNAAPSSSATSSPSEESRSVSSQRASLELHGSLHDMALGWSHEEWKNGRRLVQFWRKQEGATIHAVCKPILPEQYVPNSIVVSCIFWEVTNECYITSVDIIYLLEALVASRFNVEEKNRIRRNLEGLKPKTISKIGKSHDTRINNVHETFFKQVMSFSDPRPRHIEKDIKIFPWKVLAPALFKIISKYSAAPPPSANSTRVSPTGNNLPQIQQQQYGESESRNGSAQASPAGRPASLHGSQNVGLSIDVAASNVAFQSMQVSGGSSSSSKHPSSSSSSNPPSMKDIGGPAQFNFSDFVVSPVAFGQTPLQQSQQNASHLFRSPNLQQQSGNHLPTGLGMDLGLLRRD